MKSLYESKGKVGDPDGTRKRPAHLSGDSLADAAQQYQALNDQRSLQRAIKARPVDKKTDKWERIFGRSPLRFCLFIGTCLLMGLVSTCARATEAYYNPQGSPLPTKEMERAIEYAAESAWSQRIDEGAVYAGLTGEESTEDSIVVRWAYFPLPEGSALMEDAGLVAHSANYSANNVTLANARWWTDQDGELVKGVISINIAEATETVDKCMYELLTHEFGHTFLPHSAHSEHKEDVMFWSRGDCRYSPSLSDLAMFDKPLESCHVELTPHGDLEALDYNGKRYALQPLTLSGSLTPPAFGKWLLGAIDQNPTPTHCNGLVVDGADVWAEVKGFGVVPTVLRLVRENGLFRSIPIR